MANIDVVKRHKSGTFRRLAIGSWSKPADPQVYTKVVCDVTDLLGFLDVTYQGKVTLFHVVVQAMGLVFTKYDYLNIALLGNSLYQRKDVSAFIHVHLQSKIGYDLLGVNVSDPMSVNLMELADIIQDKSRDLRLGNDNEMESVKRLLAYVPSFLYKPMVWIMDLLLYRWNLNLSFLKLPKDRYGSYGVSSIGSLGFQEAFIPLFPFSRMPLMIAVGKPYDEWIFDGKEPQKRRKVVISFTMDHRYFDGAHFAKPLKLFKQIMQDPVANGIKIV